MPRDQCELDAGTKERIGPGLVSTAFLGLFAALGCARVVYIGVYPPRGGGVPAVVLTALSCTAWTIRSRYTMRQRGRGTWTQQCLVLWPSPAGCHLLQTITPFTVGTQYRIFVLSEDMPGQRGSLPTPSRVHLYIDGTQVQANVEKDTDFGLAILQFTASAVTHVVEIAFTNWREREMELHAVYLIPEALLGTVLGWLEGEAVAEISE